MLDKNKIKSQLAAGESVGTLVGRELAKRIKSIRAELIERLEAMADELHAQRAETAALKLRLAALEKSNDR